MSWLWPFRKSNAIGAPSLDLDKATPPSRMLRPCPPAVCTSASKTSKQTNEDSHVHFRGEHIGFIAIADGLGSSPDCQIASGLAADTVDRHLRRLDRPGASLSMTDVAELWTNVGEAFKNYYHANFKAYPEGSHPLETTLLLAVDLPDCYVISYVGNGSAWLVRGDYWDFFPRRWPWCITDLLIGHSSFSQGGREVLYGTLGPIGLTSEPHTLIISKDKTYGEIVILTTDGISSRDHARVGEDPNHKLWQEVDPYLRDILEKRLSPYLQSTLTDQEKERSAHIESMVNTFLASTTFDDDATLGIFVSERVFQSVAESRKQGEVVS